MPDWCATPSIIAQLLFFERLHEFEIKIIVQPSTTHSSFTLEQVSIDPSKTLRSDTKRLIQQLFGSINVFNSNADMVHNKSIFLMAFFG